MSETIQLNKQVYVKPQYERVIDTSFTQLVQPPPVAPTSIPAITVAEFFQNYRLYLILLVIFRKHHHE